MSGIRTKGANVLITGASRGIGAALAKAFAHAGARVFLTGRDKARLRALCEEFEAKGIQAFYATADVNNEVEVRQLFATAAEKLGAIDILIANAGVGMYRLIRDTPVAEAKQLFETNFFGVLHCIQAALPYLRETQRGQVILISSTVGKRGIPKLGVYSASKFALQGMAEALRVELAPENIRVITICPGYTESDFQQNAINPQGRPRANVGAPMPAEKVAAATLRASQRGTREVVLTLPGRVAAFLNGLIPSLLDRVLRRALDD